MSFSNPVAARFGSFRTSNSTNNKSSSARFCASSERPIAGMENTTLMTNAWSMPEVAVTQDESEEYARAYNDVKTYADEMTLKFIIGVEDIDAGWDKYISTLENFGLQTMLDIQQAALERYYQK